MSLATAEQVAMPGIDLASLAAGALAKISNDSKQDQVHAGPTPPVRECDVIPQDPPRYQTSPLSARRDDLSHEAKTSQAPVLSSPSIRAYFQTRWTTVP